MTDTLTSTTGPDHAGVVVRGLRESELTDADRILRSAFNTFLGVPDLFGDKDYAHTRWRADPPAALAVELDGQLVGSNFVACWGSVGVFGPLSIRPELWDRGIASRLMRATVDLLDERGVDHAGLFTFPHSAKHLALYQKFGFWPQYLTPVMVRPVPDRVGGAAFGRYTALDPIDRAQAFNACRELTSSVYDGLDLGQEIRAVAEQDLGEVVLVDDNAGLAAMAVCHIGPGTEGGGGGCYVKFGVARPGPGAAQRFDLLLDACEALASVRGAAHVELGVNTARRNAYASVTARGYRAVMIGVAMHRGSGRGYSRPDTWLIDDWR